VRSAKASLEMIPDKASQRAWFKWRGKGHGLK